MTLFFVVILACIHVKAESKTVPNNLNVVQAKGRIVSGVIEDSSGERIPGVTIFVQSTTIGTVSDINGDFIIELPAGSDVLVVSFVGYQTKTIKVNSDNKLKVVLQEDNVGLDEVVVVGYGIQKKESIVGAITQTTGETLLQAGGVTNVGEALQGRLPGVTTIQGSGLPGESDPLIYIRGQSSWNGGGQPLVLVDGVERSMSNIDMNEIDQFSVLKDASATAVFGVKGANGVILITTKRGKEGKAELTISANSTIKMPSKLPNKLESYDAIVRANEAIMRELMYVPRSWDQIIPMEIAEKYRNPATEEESYIYPNVDWEDVILKDFATDSRVNLSVRGGSENTKFFGSLSFQSVNDIFKGVEYDNGKGYSGEYKYNRFNYRSNLDFDITNTTKFSVNLSGYYGIQEKPIDDIRQAVSAIYEIAPSLYTPIYPDGAYGRELSGIWDFKNPLVNLTNSGYNTYNHFQMNSDFMLDQDLTFLIKGLSMKAKLSYDNTMVGRQSVTDNPINNVENVIYRLYDIDGNETVFSPPGINDFDFVVQPWDIGTMDIQNWTRMRRINYELSLNYNRVFKEKHYVTALALMKREEFAMGSMFPQFREDWVGRLTYNYDSRYFLDVNGAYNGSEKFGPGYRFELFPSAAMGWMVTNESFMEGQTWLDKLKIRGSYGLVGDDNFNGRWKYMTQWGSGGQAYLNKSFGSQSPYVWYGESVVGNANLHWETAIKSNIGVELAVLDNLISVDVDYFREDRSDILIPGSNRSVPDWLGTNPPDYNSGAVEVRGYEFVAKFNKSFANGITTWGDLSFTDARDKVIFKEDPELTPFYQKAEGYPIGQTTSAIPIGIMGSWDDIYMGTPLASNQSYRRTGYYDMVDYNVDGDYNSTYDVVPWGYPVRPQRTWNLTAGAGYAGFNLMVQFYGTQNATKLYSSRIFTKQTHIFFEHMDDYWSKENQDSEIPLSSWSIWQGADAPTINLYDASLVRLKTVELSYSIPKRICENIGVSYIKVFVNGNNLFLWSDLPDDREFNSSTVESSYYRGDYPTMKRFNFGFNVNF